MIDILKSLANGEVENTKVVKREVVCLFSALEKDVWLKIVSEKLDKVLKHPSRKKESAVGLPNYSEHKEIRSALVGLMKFGTSRPKSDIVEEKWEDYYRKIRPRHSDSNLDDEDKLINLIGPFVFAMYALRAERLDKGGANNLRGIFVPYEIPMNQLQGNRAPAKRIAKCSAEFDDLIWNNEMILGQACRVMGGLPSEWQDLFIIAENYSRLYRDRFVMKHMKLAYEVLCADKSTAILNLGLLNDRTDIIKQGFFVAQEIDLTVKERQAVERLLEENCLETLRCLSGLEAGKMSIAGKEKGIALNWYQDVEEYIKVRDLFYEQYLDQNGYSVKTLADVIVHHLLCSEEEGAAAVQYYLNTQLYDQYDASLELISADTANTISSFLQIHKELKKKRGDISQVASVCLCNDPNNIGVEDDVKRLIELTHEINMQMVEGILRNEFDLQEHRIDFFLAQLKKIEFLSDEGLEEEQYELLIEKLVDAEMKDGVLTEEQADQLIAQVKQEKQWEW